MSLQVFQVVLVALSLVAESFSLPYRAFSSRSVPGRLRSSSGPERSVDDYLSTYLDLVQQQNQQQQIPFGLTEYEPTYQQGYLSRRPQLDSEKIAALLPYISQPEVGDYGYDYGNSPVGAYADEEGTWYDDTAAPEFIPNVDIRDKSNQHNAALIQLFLDHLANKYSLEDLETLERQAILEDNSENQLQSLMPRKKTLLPVLGPHTTARNIIGYPILKGQKEEPIMIPASSVRKPMFARTPVTLEKKQVLRLTKASSTASNVKDNNSKVEKPTIVAPVERKLSSLKIISTPKTAKDSLQGSTTMEPAMKSAYDAFKTYLEQERSLRQAMDEGVHTQQKRFVSDAESLTKQLSSLKKTIT